VVSSLVASGGELSLSKEALKAFQHFKAQTGLADDDSQAILALLQQAEPENLFDDTTPQDFFRGSEQRFWCKV
jgi:hypothetical protein